MSNIYVKNYGFTKTLIKDNKKQSKNEIKWIGDYDGQEARIEVDIEENGVKKHTMIQLDNNDIMELLSVHPVNQSLDKRLTSDFLQINETQPIVVENETWIDNNNRLPLSNVPKHTKSNSKQKINKNKKKKTNKLNKKNRIKLHKHSTKTQRK